MYLSILLFFVLFLGLGYSVMRLLRLSLNDTFEKWTIMLGIGLGTFPILAVLISLLHLPLDWKLFLALSLLIPGYSLARLYIKKELKISFNITPKITLRTLSFIVILICTILLFAVYLKGAFSYPYLEDDDPWQHAVGVKYISQEKTTNEPPGFLITYIDPYPPSFDILLAILHQTNASLSWTLKFFNVLLIALGIPLFYYFAKIISKNNTIALGATIALTLLPSFMSHFIWAQTLALTLYFPSFFCLEKMKEAGWRWGIAAALISASIFVSQPSAAVIYIMMVVLYILSCFITRDLITTVVATTFVIIGGMISSMYWMTMFLRYGVLNALTQLGFNIGKFSDATSDTSGGIIYTLADFIHAPLSSKMDQPTGIGITLFLLALIGLVFLALHLLSNFRHATRTKFSILLILWSIFGIVGTEGNMFPVKMFPHRFWAFLALPLALLVGYSIELIIQNLINKNILKVQHLSIRRVILLLILSTLLVSAIYTSGYPKYVVETSQWPPGVHWTSFDEIALFAWMKQNLPKNTPVFHFVEEDLHVVGFDMYSCSWCSETIAFRTNLLEHSFDELTQFLRDQQYEYLLISGRSFASLSEKYGQNITSTYINSLFEKIQNSTTFSPSYQTNGGVLLRLNRV